MESSTSRQSHLELAERLVASILQLVFRVKSNARLRSRYKLHVHLLALDRVARPSGATQPADQKAAIAESAANAKRA